MSICEQVDVLSLPPKLTYGPDRGLHALRHQDHLVREGSELIELAEANLRELDIE